MIYGHNVCWARVCVGLGGAVPNLSSFSTLFPDWKFFLKGDFLDFFFFMYDIQHCFFYRPSDSTVSKDAVIEPRTVETTASAVRRSNHSARSHPQARLDLIHTRLDLIHTRLDLIQLKVIQQRRPFIGVPVPLHCKKSLVVFPSPTGMSPTKLSLAGNNYHSRLWTGKPLTRG